MAVRLQGIRLVQFKRLTNMKFFLQRNTSAEKKPKKYSSSIILPRTNFPLRHDSVKRVDADAFIQKVCGFSQLYEWQRKQSTSPEFILHDGPPYANGSPHMGHAINKILKDIIIRQKMLQGNKINYVPGWDCHGLPIELKALGNAPNLPAIAIRQKARDFAKKAITHQKQIFSSWGIMANWESQCYHTYDKGYIKTQLHQFFKLFEKGLIYRETKPVFWSPTSRTALAESELEYNQNHHSKAITLRLQLASALDYVISEDKIFALVWTTTPWTLPANQAICFNPDVIYNMIRIKGTRERYIIAADLVESLLEKLNKQLSEIETLSAFPGTCLSGARYFHPFTGHNLPMLAGTHVTTDKGTGLVHTAPAHGHDDFLVALQHKIGVQCLVDEAGCYTSEVTERLRGLAVLDEGNNAVLEMLDSNILHTETFIHSYPYDWRTKQPVILRASRQWFIDTAALKQRAIESLSDVSVLPESGTGKSTLVAQLQRRPYWCISRQRVWGVPIPVLYHKTTRKPLVSWAAIQHYCDLLDTYGTDFWWTLQTEQLASKLLLLENRVMVNEVERGNDILDIWFDSGVSWASVLGGKKVADLYLEGVDQFNGWFQSSLLTSVALQDRAPYKAVFVHGFAVDKDGKKMSKSLGNVIDPDDITKGRKDQKEWPAYGVDTLRWWVACHSTQHSTVSVNQAIIQSSAEAIHKIRIVMRFLLGVLHDYTPHDPPPTSFHHIDLYFLHLLYHFHRQVTSSNEKYQFNRTCSLITNFVTNDVSALYCHLIKDRLYCDGQNELRRRACQSVVAHILDTLLMAVAPILPHLAEEAYLYHPHKKGDSFFKSSVTKPKEEWNRPVVSQVMEFALKVKKTLNKTSPVTNTLELDVILSAGGEEWKMLQLLQPEEESNASELVELLQVSSVQLVKREDVDSVGVEMEPSASQLCGRCRRYSADNTTDPCARCQIVLGVVQK